MIYFDNAATTYPKSEAVYRAINIANRTLAVNAGRGSYKLARRAEEMIDDTRKRLLKLVRGDDNYDVILTPSATMAFNEIIMGLNWKTDEIVYVSPYEHNAVMRTLEMVREKFHIHIIELPLCEDMSIDLEKTRYLFGKDKPGKVFMNHVSNVTGYILPIEQITILAKEYGAMVVVDGSQSLGLVSVDLRNVDIDYLVFAGHKTLYGPLGIGGFFIKNGLKLNTYIAGGTGTDSLNLKMPKMRPERYEPASENIVAIAGLNEALKEIGDESAVERFLLEERKLAEVLIKGLREISGVSVYPPIGECGTGIVAFNIEGFKAADVGMLLDEDYDIAVRAGYHCAPLIHKYLRDEEKAGVVRASVGRYTTKEEVEELLQAVKEIAEWM